MDLSIIIVNFHHSHMLGDCLESINRTIQKTHFETILVDNSNKDNNFTKDAKNLNNNSKNNGDKKENLKEPQGNKTDFSFKSNRDTTKQAFSSVKLPDHLEKIKSKQRALKKSAKKAKKKMEGAKVALKVSQKNLEKLKNSQIDIELKKLGNIESENFQILVLF